MPSVSDCIAKLVTTGQISKQKGEEAEALYRRSLSEFTARNLGPADAQAGAALATAKTLAAGARQQRNDVAKQALAWQAYEKAQLTYPAGARAYIVDTLTPSLRGTGVTNVQTKTENLWNYFVHRLGDELEKVSTAFWGRTSNQIQIAKNVVRELHGVTTGDAAAAALGKSFTSVADQAALRARSAGKRFPFNRDWVMPQEWRSEQVRRVAPDEFVNDFETHVNSGAIRLWNKDKDRWALGSETRDILRTAYDDISLKGGDARPFDPLERTFNFARNAAGADAHLELMQKYGVGDDILGLLLGHLQKMAREISFAEVIGPNHDAIIQAALTHARREEREALRGAPIKALSPRMMFESASAAERTYEAMSGQAELVKSQFWADVMGSIRSLNSAAKLPGAVIASVPGDSVNALLAEFHNGMMPGRIIKGMLAAVSRGPWSEQKQLAQRLMVTAHAVQDMNHTSRFYVGQIEGFQRIKGFSTSVIRAGGLQYWSDLIKRTFSLEMLATLAERSGKSLAELRAGGRLGGDPKLAAFLEKYGIDDFAWDHIRQSQQLDVNGAKFVDPVALDPKIRERLLEGIIAERRYALVEPSARVRALTTGGGLPRGSFYGEVARNAFLFKSFSFSMMETWMARAATQGTAGAAMSVGTQLALMTTFAGAAVIQLKSLLAGKDVQDMSTPSFWVRAVVEGGGIGPLGGALTLTSESKGYERGAVGELVLGPVGGTLEDVAILAGQAIKGAHGKETIAGRATVRTLKHLTPATFYTKLASDRLIWDQLQKYLDPQYGKSFERTRKAVREQTGAKFWWGPGEAAPTRAPGVSGPPVGPPTFMKRPLFR